MKAHNTLIRLFRGLLLPLALLTFVVHTGAQTPEPRIDLRSVKVGGEIGRRIDITVNNNLLVLDAQHDFLLPFQRRNSKGGYIGLGKLIDSMVRLAAHTGNPELIEKKKVVIRATIQTQEEDGYIGIMAPEHRMWKLWDIHEMAYIVNGLVSDYHFFHETGSLEAATKLMDYIIQRWTRNPEGMQQTPITVFMAVTGLEESLLMLYQETNNPKYLDFCVDFRHLPEWDYPIELGRWGKIGGHAYAFFQRCLSQLRLYQMQPDDRLLSQTHKVLTFLTQNDGLLVNGVCSQHECWHDTQDGTEGLGETCSTAYFIRVLDELIRMENQSFYGDIMERAVYNGLFAAQSPDGRRLRYYVPFEGKRVYFDRDTYCCPCNYRRIIADLPSMIYYRMEGGIAVNLYTPSQAKIKLENGTHVTLDQQTDYPTSDTIKITLQPDQEATFPLFLRIPKWCDQADVSINSEKEYLVSGGRFLRIDRSWRKGDRIRIHFPMPFRFVKGRKVQAGRVAIMRGPQLFCLNPKGNESVQKLDLKEIVIDPTTLEGPFPDSSVRPNGLSCMIKGWNKMGFTTSGNHNLELRLTEFPDPDGEATYFRIRKLGQVGIDDELISLH